MKQILKLILIIAALITILLIPIGANDIIENNVLRWTNIISVNGSLSFNGTSGLYKMIIRGQNDVTNITATATLYYKNSSGSWVEIPKDWSYDVDDNRLIISETFTAVSGREYKVEFEATVSTPDYDEPVQDTQIETCP